jgi:hypothetical protein
MYKLFSWSKFSFRGSVYGVSFKLEFGSRRIVLYYLFGWSD